MKWVAFVITNLYAHHWSRPWHVLLDLALPLNMPHITLFHLQLCCVLPRPFSSSCTCILLSTFPQDLFIKCSLVVLLLCGHVALSRVIAWHHTLLESAQAMSYLVLRWFGLSPELYTWHVYVHNCHNLGRASLRVVNGDDLFAGGEANGNGSSSFEVVAADSVL